MRRRSFDNDRGDDVEEAYLAHYVVAWLLDRGYGLEEAYLALDDIVNRLCAVVVRVVEAWLLDRGDGVEEAYLALTG